MLHLPDNARQVLVTVVPASIINEIACFVFYDEHPRDEKSIDITVCTKHGEVKEYYQRDLISSFKLDCTNIPTEIIIMRNKTCELFYLVRAGDELHLLSRKENIKLHHTITNVERYDITDLTCSGQPSLRVVRQDDAVPIIFDENLDNFISNIDMSFNKRSNDELLPLITHLMRKLTEAKYNVKCNEKIYTDMLNIHQSVGFAAYKQIYPNLDDSIFNENIKRLPGALKINMQPPWIKVCNKNIVIVYNVCNLNQQSLKEVHVLLHGASVPSLEYTTKLFEETNTSPFWSKINDQSIKPKIKTAIVIVLKLEELKDSVTSRIQFNGCIFYKQGAKECLLPIEDVALSSLDTMGQDFDVLSSNDTDKNTLLAVLATTETTELILRHVKRPADEDLTIDVFAEYLHMERLPHTDNIVIHRKSPYHVLNGLMIIWHGSENINNIAISVYSRTPSQVIALLHYIHDAIPLRIVITTPNYNLTAKVDELNEYNEDLLVETQVIPNYSSYATSMLNRTGLVLEYLDNSMIKMSESKDPVIQNKLGSEIDLFANDVNYLEFKEKMRVEASKGVDMLINDVVPVKKSDSDDIMFID